ncbi:MAG: hypothetical protein PHD88_07730 [Firmicutes bacterium]|nr:hypothetical protein [Bacillota bacterium]MDD4263909.1 hypothetical protein [Bacillota bacterium]MDD4694268.1 hypothetical protein [Bacillota bacterium]
MQESLVALECLRKSSQNRVLTRIYRQLYNLEFYELECGKEIVDALKAEKYRELDAELLSEVKQAVAKIIEAVYQAELSSDQILRRLEEININAHKLSELPLKVTDRIDDGRFWQIFSYLSPWRAYFPNERLLIWNNDMYRFERQGKINSILLPDLGLQWKKGMIIIDPSYKAKLLRPYLRDGKPIHRANLLNLSEDRIISFYKAEEKRFRQLLASLTKPRADTDMIYVLRRSLLKTLACKYRTSTKEIRKRFKLF